MFLRHNLLGIFWALFILLLCGLPASEFPDAPSLEYFDVTVHVYLYAQFILLLTVGFKKQFQIRILRKRAIGNSFAISTIYGIAIEILQAFVFKERSFDAWDTAANLFGTIFGVLLFYIIYGKPKK